MKRWIARIALGLLALIALALVSGATYEALARRELASRFPLPGRRVDLGGRALHVDCRGNGSPTVVFETGLSSAGALDWSSVHDAIAGTTRACSYSRAGILSSDSSGGERDADGVAEDLHRLLERAGERPPLVLVAHSLGGLYVMSYTRKFGADVAGLVLVDTFHADSTRRMAAAGLHLPLPLRPLQIASALSWTGVVRLLIGSADAEAAYEPISLTAMRRELEALDLSAAEAGALRHLGNRPLYVLSAGAVEDEFLEGARLTPDQGRQFMAVKRGLNEEQASWSSRSRHEVVENATHAIHWQQPERVVHATRWVIDAVRADAADAGRGGNGGRRDPTRKEPP
jgi:pimeloyl-ACP methyl ester carboxylesterase